MTSRSMVMPSAVGLLAISAAMWALADSVDFDFPYIQLDHPAIQYDTQTADDPIARLQRQLDKGETTLEYDPNRLGYLPSLLKHLGVDVNSQMLVFSKSSFQGPKISPRAPRALYFNDNVAVGSILSWGSSSTLWTSRNPRNQALRAAILLACRAISFRER